MYCYKRKKKVQMAGVVLEKIFCCFQHCSKIASFWFYRSAEAGKICFRKKIQYDFKAAHRLQQICSNKMEYDGSSSRTFITLIWRKFIIMATENIDD